VKTTGLSIPQENCVGSVHSSVDCDQILGTRSWPTIGTHPHFLRHENGKSLTILHHTVSVGLKPGRVLTLEGENGLLARLISDPFTQLFYRLVLISGMSQERHHDAKTPTRTGLKHSSVNKSARAGSSITLYLCNWSRSGSASRPRQPHP
jgi:hypothetical protein